jgi:hypothetical protein
MAPYRQVDLRTARTPRHDAHTPPGRGLLAGNAQLDPLRETTSKASGRAATWWAIERPNVGKSTPFNAPTWTDGTVTDLAVVRYLDLCTCRGLRFRRSKAI